MIQFLNSIYKCSSLVRIVFFASAFLFVIYGCVDDDEQEYFIPVESITPEDFYVNFGGASQADILGQVVDVNENPIENAIVTSGSETTTTDNRGVFSFKNTAIYENFGYIKVAKTSYLNNSRAFIPSEGTNKVKIILQESTSLATINTDEIATVAINNTTSVKFNGRYVSENGLTYSGVVQVVAYHTNINDQNMYNKLPGMLYGQDKEGNAKQLETFGAVQLKLIGASGEELFLGSGEHAFVNIPVHTQQTQNAGATIPMWSFNEAHGFWIEKSIATLEGSNYVGKISQLGNWNFANPLSTEILHLDVQIDSGANLANLTIGLSTNSNTSLNGGYTNELGKCSMLVPKDEIITTLIYTICDEQVYTEDIGIFNGTATAQIILSSGNVTSVTIQGSFYNCDLNGVTNGYVFLEKDGNQFFDYINSGNYQITTLLCSNANDVTAYGVDIDTGSVSKALNFTIMAPVINLGANSTCAILENEQEYIMYKVDGDPVKTFTTDMYCIFSTLPNPMLIVGKTDGGTNYNHIGFAFGANGANALTLGDYLYSNTNSIATLSESQVLFQVENSGMLDDPQTNSAMEINVTDYGIVGEHVDFDFSGTFFYGGTEHTIIGIAHVVRD